MFSATLISAGSAGSSSAALSFCLFSTATILFSSLLVNGVSSFLAGHFILMGMFSVIRTAATKTMEFTTVAASPPKGILREPRINPSQPPLPAPAKSISPRTERSKRSAPKMVILMKLRRSEATKTPATIRSIIGKAKYPRPRSVWNTLKRNSPPGPALWNPARKKIMDKPTKPTAQMLLLVSGRSLCSAAPCLFPLRPAVSLSSPPFLKLLFLLIYLSIVV